MAVLHHPSALSMPTIASIFTKAKLSHLSSIALSPDSLIQEITNSTTSDNFHFAYGVTNEAKYVLSMARQSVELINRKKLPKAVRTFLEESRTAHWNSSLESSQYKISSRMPIV